MMIKRQLNRLFLSIFICTIFAGSGYSQKIPDRPVPPRLVNDFAKLLSSEEVNRLEQKLVAFNDSTSTQIAIVIVPDLGGYDKSEYAQDLAEKWGIGQKGKNNGVLILVKPKTADSDGKVQIATGYGLEGVIPDITCGEIVDREMIPAFKNGEYYMGFDKATSTIMSLARGEFTAAQYGHTHKKSGHGGFPIGIIVVFIIIAMISRRSGGSNNRHIGTGGLPFWMLMGMMNSGRGSGGSWGGFSGGGGGGGGFGGFGGGSFGGGGAGGSW